MKAINTGFLVQDAFGEWHPFSNDMFIIDFGKMLSPFTRNSLQSTSSHLALDGGTWTFLQSAPLQGDAGRDLGLQFKSYLANDHLEIRAGLFDGFRAPANAGGAGSRNPYRFVGRIVYNVFDTEKGYVPVGTNLGKKKILAFGAGYDTQGGFTTPATATLPKGKGYEAYGGDFMIDWPVGPGDAKDGKTRSRLTSTTSTTTAAAGSRPREPGRRTAWSRLFSRRRSSSRTSATTSRPSSFSLSSDSRRCSSRTRSTTAATSAVTWAGSTTTSLSRT